MIGPKYREINLQSQASKRNRFGGKNFHSSSPFVPSSAMTVNSGQPLQNGVGDSMFSSTSLSNQLDATAKVGELSTNTANIDGATTTRDIPSIDCPKTNKNGSKKRKGKVLAVTTDGSPSKNATARTTDATVRVFRSILNFDFNQILTQILQNQNSVKLSKN